MKTLLELKLAAFHLSQMDVPTIEIHIEQLGSIEEFFNLSTKELTLMGLNEKAINAIKNPPWLKVENDLNWSSHTNHSLIFKDDPHYPSLLKEIHQVPTLLYIKGDCDLLRTQAFIAMVGTRNPSFNGLRVADDFAQGLAQAGLIVISGLARGIDTACHRGALKANKATVAILGTGLNIIYPKENASLAQEIVDKGGLLISEFPLDTPPHPRHFPRRNRMISGMSLGVVVVEAAVKSGSLITARHALEQDREVFAIPGNIYQPQNTGCLFLIQQGAKLVISVKDILNELSHYLPQVDLKKNISKSVEPLSKGEKSILTLIDYDITTMDMIISASRLTEGMLSSILLTLELTGRIQKVPGGYVRIC